MRFRHILLPLLSFLCLSCSDEAVGPLVNEYPVEVELCCDMTKVGIDGEKLFWQSGDQVAFRATGASGASAVAVLTLNDVDSGLGKAKFRGTVVMTEEPVTCEFAYPATAFDDEGKTVFDYSSQDGTHRPYLYGSAAYSDDGMDCTLGHVGGLIRLKVADGVESVSLSSNSGTYSETLSEGMAQYDGQKISKVLLSGEGTLSPADDASHLIDVSVPSGIGTVYVFMPALEFVDGFSVVCNHSDGRKMFRSFSKTGGNFSSFTFEEGVVLDIDLSDFQGFTADCTCECEHVYDESNILTGTDVTLTGFTFSGSPEKIIDQWGVAIYDDKGRFIRWTYGEGAFDGNAKLMSDYTGDWPLLIPGEYTLHAICNINGHTLQFPMTRKLEVEHPNIQVTPIAETSWSYRSEPSKANACGNNTIERLGVKVNVSDNILNHANTDYGFKARMQNTTSGADSGEMSMNTNFISTSGLHLSYNTTSREYELKNGDGLFVLGDLAWGTHNVTVLVSFAGKTNSNFVSAYVTGLPYRHDFRAAQNLGGGTIVGNENSCHKYNGYELYYYYLGTKHKQTYYSTKFALPEQITIPIKYSTTFYLVNTTLFGTSHFKSKLCTGIVSNTSTTSKDVYTEGTVTADITKNVDTIGSAQATTPHTLSGTGNFTKDSMVSAATYDEDPTSVTENGAYIGAIEILYN